MAQIRRWIFKTTFPTMISTNSHDLQYPRTRRSIHSPGCLHQRFLQLLLAVISVVAFGCSSSSDWDVQWQEITEAIEAGNIQEAKTRLSGLLPQVQQEGPKNVHYAQVIFQLGIIAQHEGQEKQAESYFWEALTLWAQSVGPEHPHMASTLSALADLFEKEAIWITPSPYSNEPQQSKRKPGDNRTHDVCQPCSPIVNFYSKLATRQKPKESKPTFPTFKTSIPSVRTKTSFMGAHHLLLFGVVLGTIRP